MQLLDGKTLSQTIFTDLQSTISTLNLTPRLDIILVGDDPSSIQYVNLKQKKGQKIGINGQIHHLLPSTDDIVRKIIDLNHDPAVTGLMVQLPLPEGVDTLAVLSAIDPIKDADGLNPINLGKLFANDPSAMCAATPLGIQKLFAQYQIDSQNKNVVIINNSPVVGLPLLAILNNAKATVTICHENTPNISQFTQPADILISATGQKNLITAAMVKEGSIVVDVGGGDVDFSSVSPKTSFITPTFGGVGPMTVASLLYNTVKIAQSDLSS